MAFYRALADKQDQIHDPPYVAMIHGIDTYKLLTEVNKQAAKAGRIVNCLLQIHVAQEETKFGFSPEECKEMLDAGEWKELTHVRICGLMGMASNTDNVEQINREFCLLNRLFQEIKANWFPIRILSVNCRWYVT